MTLDQYFISVEIQTVLSAIVAVLSWIRFRSRSLTVRLVGLMFLTGCLANVFGLVLLRSGTFRSYQNAAGVVYLIISMVCMSYIYFVILFRKKKWFILITGILLVFSFINFFFIQKLAVNSYSITFLSVIVIACCLYYFHVLLRDLPSVYVHQLPMFWFNSSFLIYFAGNFFLFSFQSYLVNVLRNNMIIFWSFHNILSIIEHIIVLIGLVYDLRMIEPRSGMYGVHPEQGIPSKRIV
jgi:hypothetical protein